MQCGCCGGTEWFELSLGAGSVVVGYLLAQYFGKLNEQMAKEYELSQRTWYCHQCGAMLR